MYDLSINMYNYAIEQLRLFFVSSIPREVVLSTTVWQVKSRKRGHEFQNKRSTNVYLLNNWLAKNGQCLLIKLYLKNVVAHMILQFQ